MTGMLLFMGGVVAGWVSFWLADWLETRSLQKRGVMVVDSERSVQDRDPDPLNKHIEFADGVSDVVYGGECAWERDGLNKLLADLRKLVKRRRPPAGDVDVMVD